LSLDRLPPFLWGAATSSHQIDGNNQFNNWWAWEEKGAIEGGARSGNTADHWNRFREDLDLCVSLGLNSYRFSVEWSRLEPREGHWDSASFDWYHQLINECLSRNIIPMVTLHHFTLPQWQSEQGGFASSSILSRFATYVEKIHAVIGDRVKLWCTINEPMVFVSGSYLAGFMPPGICAPVMAAEANRNLLAAHVQAYDFLHRETNHEIQVGVAHNLMDFFADHKWHLLEQLIASRAHSFYNKGWLDALTGKKQKFGIPGLVPNPKPVLAALNRSTVDYVGVNYYTKAYLKWHPRQPAVEGGPTLPIGATFARKGEPRSDLEWAVHPEGFRKLLRFAASYGRPIIVTENGIADREDRLRPQFLYEHLRVLAQVISEGVDIRGYYHWSLIDNFEWIKGFKPRFGLYHIDYETLKRTARPSAHLYRTVIAAHQGSGSPQVEALEKSMRIFSQTSSKS